MATFTEEDSKALDNEKSLEEESKLQKENANFIQEPEPEIIVLPVEEPQTRELWLFNTETNKVEHYSNDNVGFANDPQYRPATDKEIKAFQLEMEFENARELKLKELNEAYNKAQRIFLKNGHTFEVAIRGEEWELVQKKVNDAKVTGFASLGKEDVNGVFQVMQNIPYEVWQDFFKKALPISEKNWFFKRGYKAQINQAKTKEEVEAIKIEFPKIETHIIDI